VDFAGYRRLQAHDAKLPASIIAENHRRRPPPARRPAQQRGQQEPQSGSSVPSGYTLAAKFSSKDGKAKFRGDFVGKSGLAVEGNHEAV
jgi:hypothetical protein